MAKSKSTNKLPPRDVIAERVEAQRRRIFQAHAICTITSRAASDIQTPSCDAVDFSQHAWVALEGVARMLDDIAGKLQADVVLAQAKPDELSDEERQS